MAGADGVDGDDEDAQLGREPGCGMDPRRLSGARLYSSSAFAFEWEPSDETGIAVSSGEAPSED